MLRLFPALCQWWQPCSHSSFVKQKQEMATKKTIAIIGATGNMGSAIAKRLASSNYRLLLFAHNKQGSAALKKEIRLINPAADIEFIGCSFEASWEADIIIPAVPYKIEKEVADRIKQVATQKIVISISNPFNESYDGLVTAPGTSAGEEMQKLLPDSKLVKAFNTIFSTHFSNPVPGERQPDVLLAGNDDEALQTVSELVKAMGFNPVIAGDISASETLEKMTVLLVKLKSRYKGAAGWKLLNDDPAPAKKQLGNASQTIKNKIYTQPANTGIKTKHYGNNKMGIGSDTLGNTF